MKILSFYLKGKMAHFRRFYSNSSSLTYTIPPRTTICGILAGLMGWERDSYYDKFSCANCGITVAPRSEIKKLVQTVNLLKVESPNELNGSNGFHTQTATEYIMPYNIREQNIVYQIWFSHKDIAIMDKLKQCLENYQPGYASAGISIALGAAYNLGWIEFAGEFIGEQIDERDTSTSIVSAVSQKLIKKIDIKKMGDRNYRIIREEIPLEFDKERRLSTGGLGNVIFDINGNPMPVIIDHYIHLNNGENITWME